MGAQKPLAKVVIDTNCVVSALVFESAGAAWLRAAWRQKRIVPVVSKETVEELLRVLAYPKFRLAPAEQEAILSDYLPYADIYTFSRRLPNVPACRDPHDEKFLKLLVASPAECMITGDGDLHTTGIKGKAIWTLAAAKKMLWLP